MGPYRKSQLTVLRLTGGTAVVLLASVAFADAQLLPLDTIRMPQGFAIELGARVDNAREMTLGANGTLFVGSMRAGKVYAVRLTPGAPAEVLTLASGLHLPVGVAFHGGALYVSAVDRILRFDDVESRRTNPPKPVVVSDRFPTEAQHGWKFIAFGPDGKLYVPVGAPCNICEPDPDRFARHTLPISAPSGSLQRPRAQQKGFILRVSTCRCGRPWDYFGAGDTNVGTGPTWRTRASRRLRRRAPNCVCRRT